jgi:hypothetical protein
VNLTLEFDTENVTLLLLLYCYFNIIVLEEITTYVRAGIFPAFNTLYLTLKFRTVFNFSVLDYNQYFMHNR